MGGGAMHLMRPAGGYTQGLLDLIAVVAAAEGQAKGASRAAFRMIELGVHIGEFTRLFMERLRTSCLYAIDLWRGGYDPADELSNLRTRKLRRII